MPVFRPVGSASGAFLALACIFNYVWSKFMHLRVQSVPLAQIGVVGKWLVRWSVAPSWKLPTPHNSSVLRKLCFQDALQPLSTQLGFVVEKWIKSQSQVLGRWVEPLNFQAILWVTVLQWLAACHRKPSASLGEFLLHGQTGSCGVKTLLKDWRHQHRTDIWMLPVTKSEKIAKRKLKFWLKCECSKYVPTLQFCESAAGCWPGVVPCPSWDAAPSRGWSDQAADRWRVSWGLEGMLFLNLKVTRSQNTEQSLAFWGFTKPDRDGKRSKGCIEHP